MAYNVLIFGASYGSLLATKLLAAGHNAKLVCVPAEVELINKEGTLVRMPVKGREGLVEIHSRRLPGKLSAEVPAAVKPVGYDLVVLAMQEPQYRSSGVRELLDAVAKAKLPCMSIMNMPPLPYLARIPGVALEPLRACYTDATVWASCDPQYMTLCSPDPQAFRPPEEKLNVLQVRLPTNFKSARFASDAHTAILRRLEKDIEALRYEGMERVVKLCVSLGADEKDLVPFEKYAAAAQSLQSPSSAARALAAGAPYIERVDRLVQAIAAQKGLRSSGLDEVVRLVDAKLEANRRATADAGIKQPERAKRSA